MEDSVSIEFVATSNLPTAYGEFKISVFQDPQTGEEHVALSKVWKLLPLNLSWFVFIQSA